MFAMHPADYAALAELSAALKASAVPAGLTDIRREQSGEAYGEHGRITARLAPAKAAANRAGRRAARQALRRAISGDLTNATRRVSKRHFAYRHGIDPQITLDRELRGERYRRHQAKVEAWREEIAAWEAECSRFQGSSLAIALWEMSHPRPSYPGFEA